MTTSTKHLDIQVPLNSLGVKPLSTPTVMTKYLKVLYFSFSFLKTTDCALTLKQMSFARGFFQTCISL